MSVCLVPLSLSFLFVLSIDAKAPALFTCLDFRAVVCVDLDLRSCTAISDIRPCFQSRGNGLRGGRPAWRRMHVTEIIATKLDLTFDGTCKPDTKENLRWLHGPLCILTCCAIFLIPQADKRKTTFTAMRILNAD